MLRHLLGPDIANPVGSLLAGTGGGNDQFLVVFELLEPSLKVRGLILDDGGADAYFAAEEGSGHFGDEFLFAVVGRAERLGVGIESAINPFAVTGGMAIMPTSA